MASLPVGKQSKRFQNIDGKSQAMLLALMRH